VAYIKSLEENTDMGDAEFKHDIAVFVTTHECRSLIKHMLLVLQYFIKLN